MSLWLILLNTFYLINEPLFPILFLIEIYSATHWPAKPILFDFGTVIHSWLSRDSRSRALLKSPKKHVTATEW